MRGVVLVVCLLGGCDVVWRLDDLKGSVDAGGDAPDAAPGCLFQDRQLLQSTTGSHDPTMSDDGLELLFVRGNSGSYDIWRVTRATTDVPFGGGGIFTELSSTAEDTDPALTADGMMVLFKSTRGGTNRAYQATRTARGQAFTTPQLAPGLTNTAVGGLDISPDGLTIYFDDNAKLVMATRASRGDPFGLPVPLTIDMANFPSVSPDGLELYYNAAGVVRRTRSTTSALFDGGTAIVIESGGEDADLTSNGRYLVFIGGTQTYVRERCPQ